MAAVSEYMVTLRFRIRTDSTTTETHDVVRGWANAGVGADKVEDIKVTPLETPPVDKELVW